MPSKSNARSVTANSSISLEMRDDGFAWVQNRTDRYVGYIPSRHTFSEEIADLSHRVSALSTFVYPEPDIKSPPVDELTLGSFVRLGKQQGEFMENARRMRAIFFAKHVVLKPDAIRDAGLCFYGGAAFEYSLSVGWAYAERDRLFGACAAGA